MQNLFLKEGPLDSHPKESNETKLDSHFDLPPLTPQLLKLPLKTQSALLRECIVNKADPQNHFFWKLINNQNYWHVISSIYFPPIDQIHFKEIQSIRAKGQYEDAKHQKKEQKFQNTNLLNTEIEDKIFIYQSRILALENQSQEGDSIDSMIQLWQKELQFTTNYIDTGLSLISSAIEDSRLQIQNLNELMSPAAYRSDFVGFQFMEIQDIQAQKNCEDVLKKLQSRVVCCVCNYEEIDDCVFIECKKCKSVIHDKCYLVNLDLTEEEIKQFVCWSCQNPNYQNYNGNKCALCSLEGGIMTMTDLNSNHDFVFQKYNPSHAFYLLQHSLTEFTIKKQQFDPSKVIPFKVRVHLSCAFWHSDCYFNRQAECFEGLLRIKEKKWKTACKVCNETNGAVIDCDHQGCSRSYHPQCARKDNIYMALIRIGKLSKETFCQKHRIKYTYEKIAEKRHQNISTLKKLHIGIERTLGHQGFSEKRQRRNNPLKHSRKKKNTETTEVQKKFCICRQKDNGGKMIECEKCLDWFHFECVKVKNANNRFICPPCKSKF